jgi:multiple antibiotic resistance protein
VVSALGWKLLAAEGPKSNDPPLADPANAKAVALGRAFMPLTTPVTVDAGVISVAVTVSANHGQTLEYELIQLIAAIIVAFGVAISILLTYRYAHRVAKKIGQRGMTVVVRLSAFIMLCIGVGIIWSGIKSLPGEIGIPHLASPSTRGSDCPDQGKSPPATG